MKAEDRAKEAVKPRVKGGRALFWGILISALLLLALAAVVVFLTLLF